MPGVKRRNQEKWPDSIRRNYKQCCVEDVGAAPAYTIYVVATPRRIWERRAFTLVVPAKAGTQCLCFGRSFCALGARCSSQGPSVAVRRGREGRAAGIAKEGDAFSTGQESGRKARPRLTDSEGRSPESATAGCRFLLATSPLDKQRRSSSATGRWTKPSCRWRQAHETALKLAPGRRNHLVAGEKNRCTSHSCRDSGSKAT